MSKLEGLSAVDWLYRCKYLKAVERSGRTRLEDWEIELKNWNPDDESTLPGGQVLATLRDRVTEIDR